MPCKITWEENGILFTHTGRVTNDEIMRMNDLMYGDNRFETIQYQISDYTLVTENLVNIQGAKIAGTLDRFSARWTSRHMKLVVVTTDPAFIRIAEHYFDQFRETEWEGRVFPDLESAYRWVRS
jgi:DNA polymerase/3'-5' exonuclease PolX